jgi:VCBS repeat-containing protein
MPTVNHPPTITSNGSGASATVSVPENLTTVTIVTASDPDPGSTLHYSIVGGADASLFHIGDTSGALSLIAVPDFEAPADANLDNTYEVIVRASDGSLSDDQSLAVTISNLVDNFVPATKFGGEFLVNTTTLDSQFEPSVAAFSDGRFVTTWTDTHSAVDDSGGAIRGQIFDATGVKSGTQFLVNTTTTGLQNDSSVAMLSDGRFVVTWADYSDFNNVNTPAVRAQIFNSSGAKSGPELYVSKTSEGPQPAVAGLADGGFVVAWSTLSTAGTDNSAEGIRAQVFSSNGLKSGAEFQVNTAIAGAQYWPAIAALNNGDFVVTWTDPSGTGADQSVLAVRGQIFHPNGAHVGSEFVVNTTTIDSQKLPAITALTDGRFVAAWTDGSETGGDTDGLAVRGQVFNADGSKSGAEFLIDSATTAANQSLPSIAALPDGRFVATWADASTSETSAANAIRAQVFNSDGSKSSVELLVDVNDSQHFAPTVAALPDGRFVVNWADQRQTDGDESSFGVHGQIFDPRGGPVHLTGTARNDDYVGTRFDDSMSGGAGNDRLDGGAGNDTAVFSQSFTKYAIQAFGGGTLVVSGPDGADTVANFEHLQFADATLEARNGAMITLDLDRVDSTAQGTGYTTTFTENGAVVGIGGDIQVKDINPNGIQTVTAAKVVLTNAHAGDSLSVVGGLQDGIQSTVDTSVAAVITLTLSGGSGTGAVSNADYQNALSHVRFANSSDNPNTADRDIAVTVSEGALDSNAAHATVHVTAVDDAPVAQNGSASGNEDNVIGGVLPATDIDGPSLTFSRVTNGAHGAVTVNANGTFSYTPNPNFNGSDSFTFKANDGSLDSNVATVNLTVNPIDDAPVAQNGSASGSEDGVINGTLFATDIDGPSVTFSRVTNAAHGAVAVNANGTFSYTPNPNFNGSDSFTFKASDGSLASNVATVSLTINPVNDTPVITSDGGGDATSVVVPENTTAVTTVAATDPDSASIAYSIIGGSDAASFRIDAATGALSFTTAPDFESPADSDHNNSYLVQVRASDGSLSDDQAITVQVADVSDTAPIETPPSDPPVGTPPSDPPPIETPPSEPLPHDTTPSDPTPIGTLPNDPTPKVVHWAQSIDVGPHPAGWLPAGIGDFNADGTSDLAWFNAATRDVDIWTLGNGQWSGSADVGSHPAGYQPVAFGDFNHDGSSDALWYNAATGNVDLWKIADSQWAGSVDIGSHPAGWTPVGSGDFNGDGTSDVAWYNAATNAIDIWKIVDGHWSGSLDVGAHPAGYQPSLLGDFNGDGTSDIAWYNASTGALDIWKIANGQWAGSADLGAHPAGWQPLGAGDFNKDGTSDIVWYNPANNNVDIWLIKNGQWAASVDLGSHPAGSVAAGVGDFDHNGVSDIIWRDTATGHVENWMLAFS